MQSSHPYTNEFLSAKRQLGDLPADLFIKQEFEDPSTKIKLRNGLAALTDNKQLAKLVAAYPDRQILYGADQLPGWANAKLMQAGSAFFVHHSEAIMSLLGLLSLPYCYTAANGAMVLYLSDRIRNDTRKRLYETAAFVWEVMAPDAFDEDGCGFAGILKVRLAHAAVRHYTTGSNRWDMQWGMPVNQEDMAGTNLSFSLLVIRGLRKLGYTVKETEQQSFMHLWNVIGYLLGLNEDLLPQDARHAIILDSVIASRQFRESEHGKELTRSLTNHIGTVNTSNASSKDILGLMRYLLGNNVADMLGINAPVLAAYKISLLKTINLVKDLKPYGNTGQLYREAHHKFKQQKPAEQPQPV